LAEAKKGATGKRKNLDRLRQYGKRLGWKGGEAPKPQEPEPIKVTRISSDEVIARAKAQADALQLTGEEREKAIQAVEEYIKAKKAEEEANSEVTKAENAYNEVLK
jgi:alkanesulfonate monooxygenase SsuD/methylene tetrahydromethanopterin reductase-like flavin-dependent oxidoreductase (luciferase family)